MIIPLASIKNNIMSTKKKNIIIFQNTNGPGPCTSYDEVFFYSTSSCVYPDVFWVFALYNYLRQRVAFF